MINNDEFVSELTEYVNNIVIPLKSNILIDSVFVDDDLVYGASIEVKKSKIASLISVAGLTGEVGEFISVIFGFTSGCYIDANFIDANKVIDLMSEAGDVIWYLMSLVSDLGFTGEISARSVAAHIGSVEKMQSSYNLFMKTGWLGEHIKKWANHGKDLNIENVISAVAEAMKIVGITVGNALIDVSDCDSNVYDIIRNIPNLIGCNYALVDDGSKTNDTYYRNVLLCIIALNTKKLVKRHPAGKFTAGYNSSIEKIIDETE